MCSIFPALKMKEARIVPSVFQVPRMLLGSTLQVSLDHSSCRDHWVWEVVSSMVEVRPRCECVALENRDEFWGSIILDQGEAWQTR